MQRHLMLDLETLGTRTDTIVTSIGVCEFNAQGVTISEEIHLSVQDQIDLGLTPDASTLLWWLDRPRAAREHLMAGQRDADRLDHGLRRVADIIKMEPCCVWGNGAAFDLSKLAHLYTVTGMEIPWKHWDERCYRTVKVAYPNIKLIRTGTHHVAKDDAATQAAHLVQINAFAGGIYLDS